MEASRPSAAKATSPGKPHAPKKRQRRTVYRKNQQEALDNFFLRKQYPSFRERLALAEKLQLQEKQVQVWFKNHRAKVVRLSRQQAQDGHQSAETADPLGPLGVEPALERPGLPGSPTSSNLGSTACQPTKSPAPAFTGPAPAFTDPAPAFTDPAPAFTDPAPAFTDPAPAFTDPAPAFTDPAPAFTGPAPTFTGPAPTFMGPDFSKAPGFCNPGAPTPPSLLYPEYSSFCNNPLIGPSASFFGPSRSFSEDVLGPSASSFQEKSYYFCGARDWECVQEEAQVSSVAASEQALQTDVCNEDFLSEMFIPNFTEVFESSSRSSSVYGYQEEGHPEGEDPQVPQLLEL